MVDLESFAARNTVAGTAICTVRTECAGLPPEARIASAWSMYFLPRYLVSWQHGTSRRKPHHPHTPRVFEPLMPNV